MNEELIDSLENIIKVKIEELKTYRIMLAFTITLKHCIRLNGHIDNLNGINNIRTAEFKSILYTQELSSIDDFMAMIKKTYNE